MSEYKFDKSDDSKDAKLERRSVAITYFCEVLYFVLGVRIPYSGGSPPVGMVRSLLTLNQKNSTRVFGLVDRSSGKDSGGGKRLPHSPTNSGVKAYFNVLSWFLASGESESAIAKLQENDTVGELGPFLLNLNEIAYRLDEMATSSDEAGEPEVAQDYRDKLAKWETILFAKPTRGQVVSESDDLDDLL